MWLPAANSTEVRILVDLLDKAKGLFGKQTPATRQAPKRKPPAAFHAVSIATGPGCCGAVVRLRGKRFLSREAPVLPVKGCDRGDCTCRYAHHEDRRKGPRRARDMGVAVDGWVEKEQRKPLKRGRRKTDDRVS
jgi:hypothetical protein